MKHYEGIFVVALVYNTSEFIVQKKERAKQHFCYHDSYTVTPNYGVIIYNTKTH